MENSFENKSFESSINDGDQDLVDDLNEEIDESKDTKKLVKSFCKNTSGHGFIRISESSKAVKWIWIIIMIATLIGLIIHFVLLVFRYFEYGINSAFYMTLDNQAVMPDITVCPNQKFSFYDSNKKLNLTTTPYNTEILRGTTFFELYSHYLDIWTFLNISASENDLARYSIMKQSYDAGILRSKYDIIVKLTYKDENINITNLSMTPTADSSICVTFKPPERLLSTLNGSDYTVMMLNVYMIGKDDSYEDVTRPFTHKEINLDGASLYLHASNTLPNFESDKHVITRGFIQVISFSQRKIIRQDVNNRCYKDPPNLVLRGFGLHETNTFDYSQNLCEETKKSERIYNICGCRSEALICSVHVPEAAPFCHQIPIELQKKINNSFLILSKRDLSTFEISLLETMRQRSLCHKNQIDSIEREMFNKICLPKCTEIFYKFDVTGERMDRQAAGFKPIYNSSINNILSFMKLENRSLDVIKAALDNGVNVDLSITISLVRFLPKQLSVEVTEESLSYPIENFLSDIGGILGLYLGFSVMSMLEIFELFVQLIIHNFIKSKKSQA